MSRENQLIAAASIAADLHVVSVIAREMSLGVKNAKAIAARAGDRAKGFQPIADFIHEAAAGIVRLVQEIDTEALKVTRIAVLFSRATDAASRLRDVYRQAQEATFGEDLHKVIATIEDDGRAQSQKLRQHAKRVAALLEDIDYQVRAAQVICSTSRVEAAHAAEFRQNLESLAENLEREITLMKQRVARCQTRLHDFFGASDV